MHAKAISLLYPMQNPHFGSKIKIPKNISKSILQIIYSCSEEKPDPKTSKHSRNETILKIRHHAKAIGSAKSSLWVKNQNSKKHLKIHLTNNLELIRGKNRSKTDQISEK